MEICGKNQWFAQFRLQSGYSVIINRQAAVVLKGLFRARHFSSFLTRGQCCLTIVVRGAAGTGRRHAPTVYLNRGKTEEFCFVHGHVVKEKS